MSLIPRKRAKQHVQLSISTEITVVTVRLIENKEKKVIRGKSWITSQYHPEIGRAPLRVCLHHSQMSYINKYTYQKNSKIKEKQLIAFAYLYKFRKNFNIRLN